MGKSEDYRQRATEAEATAGRTVDSAVKQQLLDVAQQWRTLAAWEDTPFRAPRGSGHAERRSASHKAQLGRRGPTLLLVAPREGCEFALD